MRVLDPGTGTGGPKDESSISVEAQPWASHGLGDQRGSPLWPFLCC